MWAKEAFLALVLVVAVQGEVEKRAACQAKFKKLKNHSACIAKSPKAQDPGVSDDDQKLILAEHARMRQEVSPPAKNMRELVQSHLMTENCNVICERVSYGDKRVQDFVSYATKLVPNGVPDGICSTVKSTWDADLAETAQAWASSCNMYHDPNDARVVPGKYKVGQNIAMNAPTKDWKVATGGWESEIQDFTYGGPQRGVVGHYTQCVWAETSKIGCGFAKCGQMNYYVCNYGPAGNNMKTKDTPWKSGNSCEDCPGKCKGKLCDCGGIQCLNESEQDLATCGCKCADDMYGNPIEFYKGDTCELNCAGAKEPDYCGTQFKQDACDKYSNIKLGCPRMCGAC